MEEETEGAEEVVTADGKTDVCFFCNKERKTVKGRKQKLSSSESRKWLDGVKDKATEIDDIEILQKIALHSKNAKYHHHCKLEYFNKFVHVSLTQKQPTIWHEKRNHHSIAFKNVCKYVSMKIVKKKKVYFIML